MGKSTRHRAASTAPGAGHCARPGLPAWDARAPWRRCAAVGARRRAGRADGGPHASAAVRIIVGKSESVRTDRSFSDVIVSDPEMADVVPLTDRSMSLLGKKIGTTRVSVYGEGKRLVGVFDIEVTHDTSVLGTELRERFPGARFRVASVNGRIMLSGISSDAVTVDKAMSDRQAVRRRRHQHRQGHCAAAGDARGALRRSLAQRLAATSASTGTWCGRNAAPAAGIGAAAAWRRARAPFGVLVGRILGSGVQVDVMIQALEERGVVRRLAEPNLIALSGDTASFLAGGEFPIPVASSLRRRHGRVEEVRRRPRLHADGAGQRRDQPEGRAGGQPARSDHRRSRSARSRIPA